MIDITKPLEGYIARVTVKFRDEVQLSYEKGAIQAVLTGPLPDTPEYDARAGQFLWGKLILREKKFRRSQG